MRRYLFARLVRMLVVLLGASFVSFSIIHLVPGDPAVALTGMRATQQDLETVRRLMGLDYPIPVQFLIWLRSVFSGDLGRSIFSGRPVLSEILPHLTASLELIAFGSLLGLLVGLSLSVISAAKPHSWLDNSATMLAAFSVSLPSFWMGVLLIYLFSVLLGWFPAGGREGVRSLVLPGICVATWTMGLSARLMRSSLLEVLQHDYIRTARAKGNPEYRVLLRHALTNALIPLVAVLGVQIGLILTSVVGVEIVFAWPGLGRVIADAILARDYPLIQGTVLTVALIVVASDLVADICLGFLDPRIRYS